jgi:hypothetical protein
LHAAASVLWFFSSGVHARGALQQANHFSLATGQSLLHQGEVMLADPWQAHESQSSGCRACCMNKGPSVPLLTVICRTRTRVLKKQSGGCLDHRFLLSFHAS